MGVWLAFGRGLWAYCRGLVEVWSGFGRDLVKVFGTLWEEVDAFLMVIGKI